MEVIAGYRRCAPVNRSDVVGKLGIPRFIPLATALSCPSLCTSIDGMN